MWGGDWAGEEEEDGDGLEREERVREKGVLLGHQQHRQDFIDTAHSTRVDLADVDGA